MAFLAMDGTMAFLAMDGAMAFRSTVIILLRANNKDTGQPAQQRLYYTPSNCKLTKLSTSKLISVVEQVGLSLILPEPHILKTGFLTTRTVFLAHQTDILP